MALVAEEVRVAVGEDDTDHVGLLMRSPSHFRCDLVVDFRNAYPLFYIFPAQLFPNTSSPSLLSFYGFLQVLGARRYQIKCHQYGPKFF